MAATIGKTQCVKCGKDKATMRCGGCLEEHCYKHLVEHRQELNKQLDEIEVNRDLFRQALTQQIEQPNSNHLIQQIDRWEEESTKIIQQTASEARQLILKSTNESIDQLEMKLNRLTHQLRQSHSEDDFNEIDLRRFQEELDRLTEELKEPSNIFLREDSAPLIGIISVHMSDNCRASIPRGED